MKSMTTALITLSLIVSGVVAGSSRRFDVLAGSSGDLWEEPTSVPYELASDLHEKVKGLFLAAVAHWEAKTCIRFVERTNQRVFVKIENSDDKCEAKVGMFRFEDNFIRMAPNCGFGAAVHEIGHVMGLTHEQSRTDASQYVKIRSSWVQPGKGHNFKPTATRNIMKYDYGSIMHYGPYAFSKNQKEKTIEAPVPIGQRKGLSAGDVAAIDFMYSSCKEPRGFTAPKCIGALDPTVVHEIEAETPFQVSFAAKHARTGMFVETFVDGESRDYSEAGSLAGANVDLSPTKADIGKTITVAAVFTDAHPDAGEDESVRCEARVLVVPPTPEQTPSPQVPKPKPKPSSRHRGPCNPTPGALCTQRAASLELHTSADQLSTFTVVVGDDVLLTSSVAYVTQGAALKAMAAVLLSGADVAAYDVEPTQDGRYTFAITGASGIGKLTVEAGVFDTKSEVDARIARVATNIKAALRHSQVTYVSKDKVQAKELAPSFELKKARDGSSHFSVRVATGDSVAFANNLQDESAARDAVVDVLVVGSRRGAYAAATTSDKRHMFKLFRPGSSKTLVISRAYSMAAERDNVADQLHAAMTTIAERIVLERMTHMSAPPARFEIFGTNTAQFRVLTRGGTHLLNSEGLQIASHSGLTAVLTSGTDPANYVVRSAGDEQYNFVLRTQDDGRVIATSAESFNSWADAQMRVGYVVASLRATLRTAQALYVNGETGGASFRLSVSADGKRHFAVIAADGVAVAHAQNLLTEAAAREAIVDVFVVGTRHSAYVAKVASDGRHYFKVGRPTRPSKALVVSPTFATTEGLENAADQLRSALRSIAELVISEATIKASDTA